MASARVSARFDDLITQQAWVFDTPHHVIAARRLDEVTGALRLVDQQTRAGAWAWGYVGYEASAAFDPALHVRPTPADGPPLLCFAIGGPPSSGPGIAEPERFARGISGTWKSEWNEAEYTAGVNDVRAAISDGLTYQVNLTTRFHSMVRDPLALYSALAHAQHGKYNAYMDFSLTGRASVTDQVIVSASPELFFLWDEDGLTVRPMKGTVRRGITDDADERARAELKVSDKQRAENLMIVDLLRNDLSRVAETGSVHVRSLFDAERYDTVWQLTSTVMARPRPRTALVDVFEALFPCGSVTGAPKAASMSIIAALESGARGVYCGAVGMVAPPHSGFRARFSVAIRTAVIDRSSGLTTYGAGGGITWGSDPREEYDEVLAKAAILQQSASRPCASHHLAERLPRTRKLAPLDSSPSTTSLSSSLQIQGGVDNS